jgi:mannosyltransferase
MNPSPHRLHPADPEVIVFNLKQRYTGVSATVNALLPVQMQQWHMAYCGTPLPNGIQGMDLRAALRLSRSPPAGRPFRLWHVRRDHEMLAGLWARDVLRLPIKLVFTSAAQHRHGAFPRWLISRMDAVIATTPLAAHHVPNTCAVVPHGIALSRFRPPPDKCTAWADSGLPGRYGIGVFGRVRPDKGTDVFVQAMLQVLPALPDCTAIIAGLTQSRYRSYQQDLQRQIDAAGLHERILFLGEVPAHQVHQWYQRCLLCVACPRYEPFGLTPFEAAASGCAVVCSRTGAFEQLVLPGLTGELVDTDDVPGLVRAVRQVMSEPTTACRLGQAALRHVTEHFSVEQEAAGIGRVYQQLFAAACT